MDKLVLENCCGFPILNYEAASINKFEPEVYNLFRMPAVLRAYNLRAIDMVYKDRVVKIDKRGPRIK